MDSQSNLIHDFWTYCSCYEITRNNAIWSALGALSGAVNRKVYTKIGDIPIYCRLYILLVSSPGSGKSTAVGFAENLFRAACPEIPVCPSKQSHGDIIKFMASDDCQQFYVDSKGERQEYRVYMGFIDEFKNFVAYDIIGMLNFLTGMFEAKDRFDASTLARGKEDVPFPAFCFIACENPSWMIRHIKNDTISDGIGRRVIIVHETEDAEPKPEVIITPEIRKIAEGLVRRMEKIKLLNGEFTFEPKAREWYNAWYLKKHKQMLSTTDQIFRGYLRSKHTQLLRVAMLYECSSGNPSWKFTIPLLETSLAIMDTIEPNIPKLFMSAGRNELALPQQRIIDLITQAGGELSYVEVLKLSGKDLSPSEQDSVLYNLKKQELLYEAKMVSGKIERKFYFTREGLAKAVKDGRVKINQP